MKNNVCKVCQAWMQMHDTLHNWKKCPSCGYCEDSEGYNKLNPKPKGEANGHTSEGKNAQDKDKKP